ncbi:hypothetical protein [Winogradskyella sp. 3972H.M.0a.05]|uniref:hypothetical protein n=1 Tax=Winogradskyella sp. 3972H.M.0a.05 TaxID=2950277 RepID=UPI003392F8C8
MTKNALHLLFGVVLLFSFSCKKDITDYKSEDYKFYNFQQQGWKSKRITQSIGQLNYSATEVPIQYYILKSLNNVPEQVDSLASVNSHERIVEIEFQHEEKSDLLQEEFTSKNYEESVKYMSFEITEDFSVVTSSNDTIKCSGVHFERNFKVAPFKRLLLYFNDINPNDNIKLIYHDQLFGNGVIKFDFQETPLKL